MPKRPQARRPEISLHALLGRANREATSGLRRTVSAEGLPVEFWRLLEVLGDERGRTMSELAHEAGMQLPATSKVVDRMVEVALVQRSADPSDQRRVILHVSDFGLQKIAALREEIRDRQDRLQSRFGPEREKQLRALLAEFIRANRSAS